MEGKSPRGGRGHAAARTLLLVAALLGADLAFSTGGLLPPDETAPARSGGLDVAGAPAGRDPPEVARSKTFPRLGSVALNLTPCLDPSEDALVLGFACGGDLFSAFLDAQANGDHFRQPFADYRRYYEERFARLPEETRARLGSPERLLEELLLGHGVTEELVQESCAHKTKMLSDAEDSPPGAEALPLGPRILASSVCRYMPYYEGASWWRPERWDWGRMDGPLGPMATGGSPLPGDHGHLGPHGMDFNPETNWLYVALSHQAKVAIVNLNAIDWGKVAAHEEATGMRVLLFEDEGIFEPRAILYYASEIVRQAAGREHEAASALDAAHRHCFRENAALLPPGEPWEDGFDAPTPPGIGNALAYLAAHAPAPPVHQPPAERRGWACFLAFTGVEAVRWDDPRFANAFCAYDTRHLARYDALHSPGAWSRANPERAGAGDAWRCDWLVRYVDLATEIDLKIRRFVPPGSAHDFPGGLGPALSDLPAAPLLGRDTPGLPGEGEWVEIPVTLKVGPHDIAYNPVNGHLYVTHYWTMDDPDVRTLPDWTIHMLVGNPGHPQFHNPYATRGGPPRWSGNGSPGGSVDLIAKPFPIDVGGPLDGLHPVTVDVDINTGTVFVANREANSVTMLRPHKRATYTTDPETAILAGEIHLAAAEVEPWTDPRRYDLYRTLPEDGLPAEADLAGEIRAGPLPQDDCDGHAESAADPRSAAGRLCRSGLLDATGFVAPSRAHADARARVETLVRVLVAERSHWPALVEDLRQVLPVADGPQHEAIRAFRDRWYGSLTSVADAAWIEQGLAGVYAQPDPQRAAASAAFVAAADARLPGRTQAYLDDVAARHAIADDGERAAALAEAFFRWEEDARTGALLGARDAPLTGVELGMTGLDSTFPSARSHAFWLQYCVAYAVNRILAMAHGEPGGTPGDRHKCDETQAPDMILPTHRQRNELGVSNGHSVAVVRESAVGALLDWWYEIRPRFLQPFDVWFNPGDDRLYVSNLGNHDNLPLAKGWVTQFTPPRRRPTCGAAQSDLAAQALPEQAERLVDPPALAVPCLPPTPETAFDLLLPMGHLPHHLSTNPYTFELYAGHLTSPEIIVSQFEEERASWAISKQTILRGPDTPLGAPTGMATNPASQRLFFTRFGAEGTFLPDGVEEELQPENDGRPRVMGHKGGYPYHVAQKAHFARSAQVQELLAEHAHEDADGLSRLVGVVDLRNLTATSHAIFAGDHHAVVDATRPPQGTTEDPFYNRTRELAIGGRRVAGSILATGDTSGTFSVFWRCTYAAIELDAHAGFVLPPDAASFGLRGPHTATRADPFVPDAGRCFDVQALGRSPGSGIELAPDATARTLNARLDRLAFEGNTSTNGSVWYVADAQRLTFGMVHLSFDPDDVPPGLRVGDPHGRDATRSIQADLQATEELAAAYLEVDADAPATVPRGDVLLAPAAPVASGERWWLRFTSRHHVETTPPPARLRLDVLGGGGPGPLTPLATWGPTGAEWITLEAPLGALAGEPSERVRIRFEHAATGAEPIPGRSFAIAALWLSQEGERVPIPIGPEDVRTQGEVRRILVEPPPLGRLVEALAFRSAHDLPAGGAVELEIDRPAHDARLVVLYRGDARAAQDADRKPRDVMAIEASADGGVTWRPVWRRDSRDAPAPGGVEESVEVTPLARAGALYRARFDAVDPVANAYPGWVLVAPRLVSSSGASVDLAPAGPALPASPGPTPTWVQRGAPGAGMELAFTNDRGTYEGDTTGVVCRATHVAFGTWTVAGGMRPPGSGATTACVRDLAGNELRYTIRDGAGVALVSDSFQSPGFSESHWKREESDPWGIGFAAYVYDPMPEGLGEIVPRDSPTSLSDTAILAPQDPRPGENLFVRRGLLIETPAADAQHHVKPRIGDPWAKEEVTEASARVDDAAWLRRAFVVTPGEADLERLPEGLRAVVRQEGGFLNATHVKLMLPPDPIRELDESLRDLTDFASADPSRSEEMGDAVLFGLMPSPETTSLDPFVEELRESIGLLLASHAQRGLRTHLDVEPYILEAVPTLRPVAHERLSHPFTFDPAATPALALDLRFDVSVRHRYEDYVTIVRPGLPLPDLTWLVYLLHNVTLDKINMTQAQFEALVGPDAASRAAFGEASWMANTTLHQAGATLARAQALVSGELDGLLARLSFGVAQSEILNGRGHADLNLPVYGDAYAVRVVLEAPGGERHVLVEHDGFPTRTIDLAHGPARPDVRVTLAPADAAGAFEVRLGAEFSRIERLHRRVDATEIGAFLPEAGEYTLAIETSVQAPIAPAPGLLQEVGYGPIELRATLAPDTRAPPDASFAWQGPVAVGAAVAFEPTRATPILANAEDLDGRIARYTWRFGGADVGSVNLDGRRIVPDDDPELLDDAGSNAVAIGYGHRAAGLTLVQEPDGTVVLSYATGGCHVPVPSVRFPTRGPRTLALTVVDDDGRTARSEHMLLVGEANLTRPFEMLVEPTADGGGNATLYWQENRGSLLLDVAGRSLDLLRFAPPDLGLNLSELDPVNLSLALDLQNTTNLTREEVAAVLTSPNEYLRAILEGRFADLDTIVETLLVRPATIRVHTAAPEDATNGTRFALRLGATPGRDEGAVVPLLDRIGGALPPELAAALGVARPSPPTVGAPPAGSPCAPVDAGGVSIGRCNATFEGIETLVERGVASAWMLRYALHPEKDGAPDLNRSLAQIVVLDSGWGPLYLALLEGVDDARQIGPSVGDGLVWLAGLDLDPLLPADAYRRLAGDLANATLRLAATLPAAAALSATARTPPGALPHAAALPADALGLDPAALAEELGRIDGLYAAIDAAHALAAAASQSARDAVADATAEAHADADSWAGSMTAALVLAPTHERIAHARLRAETDLAGIDRTAAASAAAAREAVDAIHAATNATLAWAEDWTAGLAEGDPAAVRERAANATRLGARAAGALVSTAGGIERNLTGVVDELLTLGEDDAVGLRSARNQSLVLGYDARTGRAIARVGSTLLADGVAAGPRADRVHASVAFVSILPRQLEIQSIWAGHGATLLDGFNRDGLLDERFVVEKKLPRGAEADARTALLAGPFDPAGYDMVYVTRSPESGIPARASRSLLDDLTDPVLTRLGKLDPIALPLVGTLLARADPIDRVNEHRHVHDGRASPPATPAGSAPEGGSRPRLLADPPAEVAARAEAPVYSARVRGLDGNAWQELRVGRTGGQPLSTPAKLIAYAPPAAPHVFDVAADHPAGGRESLRISLQPSGPAWPPVQRYEAFVSPRPTAGWDPSDLTPLALAPRAIGTLAEGENGWREGVDFQTLVADAVPPAFADDWRYVAVRAVNDAGPGPLSPAYLLPPARLEERFATQPVGAYVARAANVTASEGRIELDIAGLPLTLEGDACLGDTVGVTRVSSYPHDQIAAPWARALLVRERGLDTLLALANALGQPLASLPLDLRPLDVPLPEKLHLCPSLSDLVRQIHNLTNLDAATLAERNLTRVLSALGTQAPSTDSDPIVETALDGRALDAWRELARQWKLNLTLDLDLDEIVGAHPAGVTWTTEPIEGAWHARTRFQIPSSIRVPALGPDTSLADFLPESVLTSLGALLPGEPFHVLQVGHVDAAGDFTEIARVDLDRRLPLAATALLESASVTSGMSANLSGALPDLGASAVVAGDTRTHAERIGLARYDRWHTVELFSTGGDGAYSVSFDGNLVGQLRTSSRLAPNALRVGGSSIAQTVLLDDLRLMPALHPPAPLVRVLPAGEAQPFTAVRWYQPETGGAPLADFNLLRRDPGGGAATVVATAGGGGPRSLLDPTSFDPLPGHESAYAVQAVNARRAGADASARNVGPASDARLVRPPAFWRVAADTSVSHAHGTDLVDDATFEGARRLFVGNPDASTTWSSVLTFNASELVDAAGRRVPPDSITAATMLLYHDPGPAKPPPLPDPALRKRLGISVAGGEATDCFGMVGRLGEGLQLAGCFDAGPVPLPLGLCEDFTEDLELQLFPFACAEDTIGAYVAPTSSFPVREASYATLPRRDLHHRDDAIDRQVTRNEAWRRYELGPSLARDGDGDVAVVLRKASERPGTVVASYVASEASSWLDEQVGPDGRTRIGRSPFVGGSSPAQLPWSDEHASSGARSLRLAGGAGIRSVEIPLADARPVPLDVPIRMDVFVPAGSAPREIGLRMRVSVGERASISDFPCERAFPGLPAEILVTWGSEHLALAHATLTPAESGRLLAGQTPPLRGAEVHAALDLDGELDAYADLMAPIERAAGHHAGGVPTQRDVWVTLGFDLVQALLENANYTQEGGTLLDLLLGRATSIQPGLLPSTRSVPSALPFNRTVSWRATPTTVLGVPDPLREKTDGRDPYDTLTDPWYFMTFHYDLYLARWACGLHVHTLEVFVVDGEAYVDRIGPDMGPRVRVETTRRAP